ncbi:MAG: hypothetical protein ACXAHE_05710 [Roseburia sp. 1XD42-69]
MKLRRAAALMMVSVMAFAATGCGGGDDTKKVCGYYIGGRLQRFNGNYQPV